MLAVADELVAIIDDTAPRLRRLTDARAAEKPTPNVWSCKEVLCHLIDSAANNHQRFIRAQQADPLVLPGYDQEGWVRAEDPQGRSWAELVTFWEHYNRHLAHVIGRIPPAARTVTCRIGTYDPVTLEFLVTDYVSHMRHHLAQINERGHL